MCIALYMCDSRTVYFNYVYESTNSCLAEDTGEDICLAEDQYAMFRVNAIVYLCLVLQYIRARTNAWPKKGKAIVYPKHLFSSVASITCTPEARFTT